jgi:acyl carrier protein
MNNEKKAELIAELLDVEVAQITAERALEQFDTWDSMAALSLIVMLDEHFQRTDIDSQKIKSFKTVNDLFNVMELA